MSWKLYKLKLKIGIEMKWLGTVAVGDGWSVFLVILFCISELQVERERERCVEGQWSAFGE